MTGIALVVDDDELSARFAAQLLAPLALMPRIALTLRQAEAIALAAPPDLALLDITLPDGSGYLFGTWLRRRWPRVAILFASGYAGATARQRASDAGADGYLLKPYTPRELQTHAQTALIRHGWHPQRSPATPIPATTRPPAPVILLNASARLLSLPDGRQILLTPTETRLIEALLHYPGQICTTADLCGCLDGDRQESAAACIAVDAHLRRLRSKIELDPLHPRYLLYLPGHGARFVRHLEPIGVER